MQLSEQTKIEAQIGFTIGILVGAVSAWVLILFFTDWEWYFKVFSSIGSAGIVGSLSLGLHEIIRQRRMYLEAKAEMEKINSESKLILENKTQ